MADSSTPRFHTRAIDRLEENIDPALRLRLSRWEHRPMCRPPQELPMAWREPRTHVDPRRWYAGYLGVRDEYEPPYELRRDLKEQVPQALLRDLHRVVRADIPIVLERQEGDRDPGGAAAYREAKEALRRTPLPVVVPLVLTVMEEQQRRRRFLREPWQAMHPDEAPRHHSDPTAVPWE